MNWLVCLEDGPFDGRRQRIPSSVNGPPATFNVCLCPCCGALALLEPDDHREDELLRRGARMAPYRLADLSGLAVGYRYVTPEGQARELNEFYGLTGDLAVTAGGRL